MSGAVITLADQRREEAELLVCRLLSDFNRLTRDFEEVKTALQDKDLLQCDTQYIADYLSACLPALMRYDLLRLVTLIREGF